MIVTPTSIPIPGTATPAPRAPSGFRIGLASGLQTGFNRLFGELASDLSQRRVYRKRIRGFKSAGFDENEAEALATLSETDPNLAGQVALQTIRQRQERGISPAQMREYFGYGRPEIAQTPEQQAVPVQQPVQQQYPLLAGAQPIAATLLQGLQQQMRPQGQPQQWPGTQQPQQLPFVPAPLTPRPQPPMIQPEGRVPEMRAPEMRMPEERRPFSIPRRPFLIPKEISLARDMKVARYYQRERELQSREKLTNAVLDQRKRESEYKKNISEKKFKTEQEKQKWQEKKAVYDYNHKFITGVLDNAKSAKEFLRDVNKMQQLSERDKLSNPLFVGILEKLNLDFNALLTPDSQQYRKLEKGFLRNARAIFGARVTNYEAKMFLQTIPTLSMTKEGREQVTRALQIIYEGQITRANMMNEILKQDENNPDELLKLESKLYSAMEDEEERLHDEFLNIIETGNNIKTQQGLPQTNSYKDLGSVLPLAVTQKPLTKVYNARNHQTYINDGKKWIKWTPESEEKIKLNLGIKQ